MTVLVIIILAVVVVALYPVVRDFLRRRQKAAPAYVEGLQLLLDGRPEEATEKLKEAVGIDSTNVDAYIRLGNIFIGQGDVERGIAVHERLALRRNLKPDEEKALYRALAADYLKTDRRLKAVDILEELVRLERDDSDAAQRLFWLYIETESWDKCRELLKELTRHARDRRWVARLLAEFGRAWDRGEPGRGRDSFQEALRLDRGCLAALLYSGDSLMAQGDTEAALRTWNEIVTLAPEENFLVRRRLESAYYELGRYDDITQLYEGLLRRVPDDQGLALALAGIYQKKQSVAEAVRLLERTVARDGEAIFRVTLADLYLQQGNAARAQRVLAELTDQLRSEEYRCASCGTAVREPVFGCGNCHAWLVPLEPASR